MTIQASSLRSSTSVWWAICLPDRRQRPPDQDENHRAALVTGTRSPDDSCRPVAFAVMHCTAPKNRGLLPGTGTASAIPQGDEERFTERQYCRSRPVRTTNDIVCFLQRSYAVSATTGTDREQGWKTGKNAGNCTILLLFANRRKSCRPPLLQHRLPRNGERPGSTS